MKPGKILPRLVEPRLKEALADTPVVLIHGPRQCGKTTLAQLVGRKLGYAYVSLDEEVARAAAETDPVGFVADLPRRVVLDEVQYVPSLFRALKVAVDRDRAPGRFLLTGSANLLFVPQLAESLVGRMEILRLFPFAQCEIEGAKATFLDRLFQGRFPARRGERLGRRLAERIVAGGFPVALARRPGRRRAAWYKWYVETLIQRDVRSLARIASLGALPQLLALAAAQTACLLNVAGLAGPFELSRPTIRDYLTLLEHLFLVEKLPPWHSNRLSRLVKKPKLHMGDTGLAAALLGLDAAALYEDKDAYGRLLETFVFGELRRLASGHEEDLRFHHFRVREGYEVDLVLEWGGRKLAGIEVKASSTVTASDFRGLRKLAAAAGKRFVCGVVLYDGEVSLGFGDHMYAVPVWALWEKKA